MPSNSERIWGVDLPGLRGDPYRGVEVVTTFRSAKFLELDPLAHMDGFVSDDEGLN